jgi:hypothetical protein
MQPPQGAPTPFVTVRAVELYTIGGRNRSGAALANRRCRVKEFSLQGNMYK